MLHRRFNLVASAAVLFAASTASAGVHYRESVSGDLSDNRLAPTQLGALDLGANTITGQMGPSQPGSIEDFDLDYVTFTVPAGLQLEKFIVLRSDVGGAVSFVGLQAGPRITVPLNQLDPAPLLGWHHYGSADQGLDILRAIAAGAGAQGFRPPLPAGVYTLWIMELDAARDYEYSFELRLGSACGADFNSDGVLDPDDLSDYIACFFAPAPCLDADLNGDGVVDPDDLSDYIGAFFAGC